MAGWIYILEHSSGTTVKVGETRVSPQAREQDYIKVYKLQGFKLAKTYKVPEQERKDIEKITHKNLQNISYQGLKILVKYFHVP